MKKGLKRAGTLLLAVMLICALLAMPAGAVSNTFTEGEYISWIVASEGAEVLDCWADTALLPPGTSLTATYDTIVLSGTPTTPGTYEFFVDAYYSTPDGDINRGYSVTVTVAAAPAPTPVQAASGTNAATPPPAAPEPTSVPDIVITKHPSGETVTAGSSTYFVARANNVSEIVWRIVMPDGSGLYEAQYAHHEISGLNVTGQGTETLSLANIPLEMDGWYVECKFIGLDGVSQVVTNRAKITVTAPATATPRPTEAPTPTPEAEETAETGAVKGLAGDAHEHSFDRSWSCDAQQHWKECSCGERGEEGSHRLSWTVTREAGARTAGEREGVCDDCGFTVTETIEPQEEAGSKKGAAEPAGDEKDSGQALVIVLTAVGGALLAAVVILAVLLAKKSRR